LSAPPGGQFSTPINKLGNRFRYLPKIFTGFSPVRGRCDQLLRVMKLACRVFAGISCALLCISVQLATGVTDKS
jgi:hypothetical protein